MIEKLKELLKNSYSPYSSFAVSCIVVMKDGTCISGVNVENASYGATICAERNAITSAISMGYKKYDFKEINIMCNSEKIGTPCFVCRQVLTEFFEKDCIVICFTPSGISKTFTVEQLCPFPFDENNLN